MNEKRVLIRAESFTELSIRRRCEIVGLARSSQYYDPVDIDAKTLALMRKLDELALQHPYWGSRNVVLELRTCGVVCNRKRVQRLRRLMGIESVAPKPNLSKPRSLASQPRSRATGNRSGTDLSTSRARGPIATWAIAAQNL